VRPARNTFRGPAERIDTAALIGYGYRPLRVLWALAVLLLLVVGSLELPAGQATLRATNGSGAVYSTSGLLAGSVPATAGPARLGSCGDGEVRCFSPVLHVTPDLGRPLIDSYRAVTRECRSGFASQQSYGWGSVVLRVSWRVGST
jgi:hypothetical protein